MGQREWTPVRKVTAKSQRDMPVVEEDLEMAE